MPRHRGTRTRRWVLPLVSGALTASLLGAAFAVFLGGVTEEEPPTAGPPAQSAEVAETQTPRDDFPGGPAPEPPTDASEGRVIIPSLLNTELRAMGVSGGVVNPPSSDAIFLIEGPGYGSPRTAGTTYLAVHTSRWQSGEAIGDALFDGTDAAIAPGASVHVDGVEFVVSEVLSVTKSELPATERLWDGSADLILLTCRQTGWGGPSSNNLAILADRRG